MAEVHSTYQWKTSSFNKIEYTKQSKDDISITVKATLTKDKIFALITGIYQVTVEGVYNHNSSGETEEISIDGHTSSPQQGQFTATCICQINNNPKLCTIKNKNNCTMDLILTGEIVYNDDDNKPDETTEISYTYKDFKIQEGSNDDNLNEYLYVLENPKLITHLTIDGNNIIDKTYVEGSSIPIDKIKNISTKDFHNIEISTNDNRDIFSELSDPNGNGVTINTNALDIHKLTVINLPESKGETIYICKSKSKNNGITFKMSNPDNSHFGYVMYIQGQKAAGYNSVWVNRKTLDGMFENMPDDIMSTTEKFEYKGGFRLHKLTYEEVTVTAPDWVNNDTQHFTKDDIDELNKHAPTYYKGTINESTSDINRSNNMILKNIEFVKFGDKVIKLNYEPLSEAQNQSI